MVYPSVVITKPMAKPDNRISAISPVSPMKAKTFDSILDVPTEHWDTLLENGSYTRSHAFWEVIEQSGLNDFRYRHAIFYESAENPVALTSFYTTSTDIAMFGPTWLQRTLGGIRKHFPGFLRIHMLECGTPVTLTSPYVKSDHCSDVEVVEALNELLLLQAKKERALVIVVRDFEADSGPIQPIFRDLGYHLGEIFPNTFMDVPWSTPEQYLSSMKSYYRSKLLKHLRINEQNNIRHELRETFHELADELCEQWKVVHYQADEYQREVLTPEFYRGFSEKLGDRSKALLFFRGDELIGHALLLLDGEMLRWLYFGRKEACNDSLYIYVGHKVIETAILLEARKIELGLTTYSVKKDLGAQMTPTKLALRSPWRIINPLIGLIYPLLNRTPEIKNKNIFKAEEESKSTN